MEQELQNKNPLLSNAITKFTPEVFLHPVWLRFGKKDPSASLQAVDDLLGTFNAIQKEDRGMACQILLICAAYQNDSGQWFNALRTIQRALTLTQHSHLVRERIWSLWGTIAILIQQGDHEQACIHLVDLQAVLNEQNEWVLAGFVDVFRQTFSHFGKVHTTKHQQTPKDYPLEDTLGFTFDWLFHWGFWARGFETKANTTPAPIQGNEPVHMPVNQSFFSVKHLQDLWHALMLSIRDQLHRQWMEDELPSRKRRFSFLKSLPTPARSFPAGRRIDTQITDSVSPIDTITLASDANNSSPLESKLSEKSKAIRDQPLGGDTTHIPVAVHMLGTFSMTVGELAIKLPASRGLSLLKYLLVHRKKHITRETLMETFWPDSEPETARNSLDVALHSLRKSLRSSIFMPVIIHQDGGYTFEPSLQIWLDVDEFESCVRAGQQFEARNQRAAAVTEYETAISLYQGDFLEQNPYEGWTVFDRERLRINYLDTLDRLSHIYFDQEHYAACIAVCQLILARDLCREDTHGLLMRCFGRQGQTQLALRQYHICVEALHAELEVDPALETINLYQDILHRRQI